MPSRRTIDFQAEIEAIQAQVAENTEWEVWAMDEHRLGLKPVVKRMWAPIGQTPSVTVKPRYVWLYVYAFVHPTEGETFWLILPTVNIELFSLALHEFAEHVGAGKERDIVLVLDQAGWHFSEKLKIPPGIHLLPLPSHSPELQPAERLWELTDEVVANQCFDDLDQMEATLAKRCYDLMDMTEAVRGRTNFHWWQRTVASVTNVC